MAMPSLKLEGKYEILRKLHAGGMGDILLVRHRMLDEERVIKTMRPQLAGEAQFRQRFYDEARAASKLKHENIAQVHDFNVDEDGNAYIVLEYIDGVSFKEILEHHGPPSLELALEMARQGVSVLEFLHRRQKVHRDISPDNLMLARTHDDLPKVKLIDLGIVKDLEKQGRLTTTGHFLGKVRYSSPEHFGELGAGGAEPRSDQYSFGLVLYELLTGRSAIVGSDPASYTAGHLYRAPISFVESDPDRRLPEDLRAVVMRALAKRPTDRFDTTTDFSEALSQVAERLPYSPKNGDLETLIEDVIEARKVKALRAGDSTQARLDEQFGLETTPGKRSSMDTQSFRTPISHQKPDEQTGELPTQASVVETSQEASAQIPTDPVADSYRPPTTQMMATVGHPEGLDSGAQDLGQPRPTKMMPTYDGRTPPPGLGAPDFSGPTITPLDAPADGRTIRLGAEDLRDVRRQVRQEAESSSVTDTGTLILGDIRKVAAEVAAKHAKSDPESWTDPSASTAAKSTAAEAPLSSSLEEMELRPSPPATEDIPLRRVPAARPTTPLTAAPRPAAPAPVVPPPAAPTPASPSDLPPVRESMPAQSSEPEIAPKRQEPPKLPPLPIPAQSAQPSVPVEASENRATPEQSMESQPLVSRPAESQPQPSAAPPSGRWAKPAPRQSAAPRQLLRSAQGAWRDTRAALGPMTQSLRKEAAELWQVASPILARYRIPLGVLVGVLVLGSVFAMIGLTRNPEPTSSELSTPEIDTAVATPAPVPAPSDSKVAELHPEVDQLELCWGWDDLGCVENQLAVLDSGELALSDLDHGKIEEIRRLMQAAALEAEEEQASEAAASENLETLLAMLDESLTDGPMETLLKASNGLFKMRQESGASIIPEDRAAAFKRGHEISQHFYKMWAARKRTKKPLDVIENANWLLKEYPVYANASRLRDDAAQILEKEADALHSSGKPGESIALLSSLHELWPDRDGLGSRIAKSRALVSRDQTTEDALAKVQKELNSKRPEAGLKMLDALQVPPAYAGQAASLRKDLQKQLADLDQQPPALEMTSKEEELRYRKKEPAVLRLKITDDLRVEATQVYVRYQGEQEFKASSLTLEKSSEHRYRLEIPESEHQRRKSIELYITATDPSGQVGSLGSKSEPITFKRRRF